MKAFISSAVANYTKVLVGLTGLALFVAGLISLGLGVAAAWDGKMGETGTFLTAGLVLLFAATIDRFESLKGLGVEAKTRQLDKKIEQADTALKRLQELAQLTGAYLVDLNSRTGRIGVTPSPDESFRLAQAVRGNLEALGCDPAVVRNALTPWARSMCFDRAQALFKPVRAACRKRFSEELPAQRSGPVDSEAVAAQQRRAAPYGAYPEKLNSLHQVQLADWDSRIQLLVDELPPLDPAVTEKFRTDATVFIADIRDLQRTLTLRDPAQWFAAIGRVDE